MKFILCFILMVISTKECDKNKTELSNNATSEISQKTIQDSAKVTYQAATRGFFLKIWIEGDSITFTNDNMLKTFHTYQIPSEEREAFYKLLSETDEKSLPELIPPTKTHQYDAAAMATLEISKGEMTYMTETFDHGKPPKSINDIVKKMLSIKTMMEKQ